jgi:hypothetical protein
MTVKNRCGHSPRCAPASLISLAVLAAVPFACHSSPTEIVGAAQSAVGGPTLGVAASFLVLGGSTVTNTGPTTIMGDLGVAPGLAITGFPPGLVVGGATHAGDATALQAQSDVTAAYTVLAGDPCAHDLTGKDLGGLTLTQGVYCFSSEAQLTGNLVLDAQGDAGAVFIFQIGSTLTTGSNASVVFTNGGQDCRAFWQIGSSATLGTDTVFAGSILALTSITLNTGASVSGRALARNGAVTMDDNHVFSTTCVASGTDAGADGAVEASSGSSGSGSSSSGVSEGGSSGSGSSSSGVSEGGGSTSSGSSGGDAAVDGSVTESGGGEAGGGLCCGGVLCGASCTNLSGDIANCGSCGTRADRANSAPAGHASRAPPCAEGRVSTSPPTTPTAVRVAMPASPARRVPTVHASRAPPFVGAPVSTSRPTTPTAVRAATPAPPAHRVRAARARHAPPSAEAHAPISPMTASTAGPVEMPARPANPAGAGRVPANRSPVSGGKAGATQTWNSRPRRDHSWRLLGPEWERRREQRRE